MDPVVVFAVDDGLAEIGQCLGDVEPAVLTTPLVAGDGEVDQAGDVQVTGLPRGPAVTSGQGDVAVLGKAGVPPPLHPLQVALRCRRIGVG